MNYPKILSVTPLDDYQLIVRFDNRESKKYDVTTLLDKEMFMPLKNQAFFKSVNVEKGGYAVVWNNNIDISEYELWLNGKNIDEKG